MSGTRGALVVGLTAALLLGPIALSPDDSDPLAPVSAYAGEGDEGQELEAEEPAERDEPQEPADTAEPTPSAEPYLKAEDRPAAVQPTGTRPAPARSSAPPTLSGQVQVARAAAPRAATGAPDWAAGVVSAPPGAAPSAGDRPDSPAAQQVQPALPAPRQELARSAAGLPEQMAAASRGVVVAVTAGALVLIALYAAAFRARRRLQPPG